MERNAQGIYFLPLGGTSSVRRQRWAARRFGMEVENLKRGRHGGRTGRAVDAERLLLIILRGLLKVCGLYRRGVRNARDIQLRELDLHFADLPEAFDGFTILHVSDLHIDRMPEVIERSLAAWNGREVDLCVLTGDYRDRARYSAANVMAGLRKLTAGVRARRGVVAVLGNHDHCGMVAPMEAMGIRVLLNETLRIDRGGQHLQIVGTDDVHAYATDDALAALDQVNSGFSIALVHSAELYDAASRRGVDLYLCGHTHGGQVCLPGGWPISRSLRRGRAFFRGTWRHGNMVGVTNYGAGTSGVPVRFNTRGELLVIRLRRKRPGSPRHVPARGVLRCPD